MTQPITTPRSVRLATRLAIAAGFFGLIQSVFAFAERLHLNAGIVEANRDMAPEMVAYTVGSLQSSIGYEIFLGACVFLACIPLGLLVSRGRNLARKLLWIIGTPLIIGQVVLLTGDSELRTGQLIPEYAASNPARAAALNRALIAAWYIPVHYVAEIAILSTLIAACIMLAQPTSQDFFTEVGERESSGRGDDTRLWRLR